MQGFNYIAWQLCRKFPDDWRVFHALCRLLEDVHSLDYFEGMRGLLADLTAIAVAARENFPRLMRRLQRWELSLDAALTSWLVCLFTAGQLEPELKERLLEFVIAGGRPALLRLVFVALKELNRSTSSKQSLEELAESIRGAERCFNLADWAEKAGRLVLPSSLTGSSPAFFVLASTLDLRDSFNPLHFLQRREGATPRSTSPPRLRPSLLARNCLGG